MKCQTSFGGGIYFSSQSQRARFPLIGSITGLVFSLRLSQNMPSNSSFIFQLALSFTPNSPFLGVFADQNNFLYFIVSSGTFKLGTTALSNGISKFMKTYSLDVWYNVYVTWFCSTNNCSIYYSIGSGWGTFTTLQNNIYTTNLALIIGGLSNSFLGYIRKIITLTGGTAMYLGKFAIHSPNLQG